MLLNILKDTQGVKFKNQPEQYLPNIYIYINRGEACTGFWWGNLRERDHGGDPDVDEGII
jgi:hypothetical protein